MNVSSVVFPPEHEVKQNRQRNYLLEQTAQLHFFKNLYEKYQDSLFHRECCESFQTFKCQAGQVVFDQGSASDAFFVVLEGSVQAVCEVHSNEGSFRVEKTIQKGGYFGELGLISDSRRSALVMNNGNSATHLAMLHKNDFHRIFSSKIQVEYFLSPYTLLLKQVGFLAHLNDLQLQSFISHAFFIDFQQGQLILIERGRQPQGTLVLLEGSIEVDIRINSEQPFLLHPGDILNEEFLLDCSAPAAYTSICASQNAKMLFLSTECLLEYIMTDVPAYENMLISIKDKQQRQLKMVQQTEKAHQASAFKLKLYPCAEEQSIQTDGTTPITDVSFSADIFSIPSKYQNEEEASNRRIFSRGQQENISFSFCGKGNNQLEQQQSSSTSSQPPAAAAAATSTNEAVSENSSPVFGEEAEFSNPAYASDKLVSLPSAQGYSDTQNEMKETTKEIGVQQQQKQQQQQPKTIPFQTYTANNSRRFSRILGKIESEESWSDSIAESVSRSGTQPNKTTASKLQCKTEASEVDFKHPSRCFELYKNNSPTLLHRFVERSTSVNMLKKKFTEQQMLNKKKEPTQISVNLSSVQLIPTQSHSTNSNNTGNDSPIGKITTSKPQNKVHENPKAQSLKPRLASKLSSVRDEFFKTARVTGSSSPTPAPIVAKHSIRKKELIDQLFGGKRIEEPSTQNSSNPCDSFQSAANAAMMTKSLGRRMKSEENLVEKLREPLLSTKREIVPYRGLNGRIALSSSNSLHNSEKVSAREIRGGLVSRSSGDLSPVIVPLARKRSSQVDLRQLGSFEGVVSGRESQRPSIHRHLKVFDGMLKSIPADKSPAMSPLLDQLHENRKQYGIANMKRFISSHVKRLVQKKIADGKEENYQVNVAAGH